MKREEAEIKNIIDMSCEHFVAMPNKCKVRLAKTIITYLASHHEKGKSIDDLLKGCEHDGSFIPVNEVKRLMEELASQSGYPEVTDKMIKTEMDNYFNKLQRNPLPDLERFRIEVAFEYAAKWTREQMKNR